MLNEYTQSEELYKGFKLQIIKFCLFSRHLHYNRRCNVFKGEECVSQCKTKKEAKELIDGGYIK